MATVDRAGFHRLVADVGMGRAGLVPGREVSRLARNSTDWHRLLEICALTDTLILDEDGLYGPAHATVKHLREQRRLFPIRLTAGARTGAPVAVVDVDAAGVERVVSEIAAAGGTAHEPVTI